MTTGPAKPPIEPFYFGAEKPLFGCYHRPQRQPQRSAAVVLCHPMGEEYIRFHRAFRQLAMQLSVAGFPVLRFDFYGCGDSAGDDQEWGLRQWQTDLNLAIAEARRRCGSTRIALAGLRMGATVAANLGAARQDIAATVLWDVVLDGNAHLEHLQSIHNSMLRRAHVLRQSPDRALPPEPELLGFRLCPTLQADISAIDLMALPARPSPHVLLVESNHDERQAAFAQRLQRLDAATEHISAPIPRVWVWEEGVGKVVVPYRVLQAISSWLARVCP